MDRIGCSRAAHGIGRRQSVRRWKSWPMQTAARLETGHRYPRRADRFRRPTDGPPNRYRRLAYRPVGTGAHRSQERGRPPRPATIQSLPGDRPTGLTARYGAWHATGATTGTAADVERHATPSGHPGKFPSSQKWNERQSRSDFAKLSAWYFFGRSLYPAKSHDERQRLNLIGLPST